MSQPPVDLLPEHIRRRGADRDRAGRLLAASVLAAIVVAATCAHARVLVSTERARVRRAEARAADVITLERRVMNLLARTDLAQRDLDRYGAVAPPLPVSGVLATLVNELPAGVTLVRAELETVRRGAGAETGPPPRVLSISLTGFAPDEADVVALVERLSALDALDGAALDYSRTRAVRGRPAREFRVSGRVDLETTFEVVPRIVAAGEVSP